MHHRPYTTLLAAVVLSGTALAACGGSSESAVEPTIAATTMPDTTLAPTSTEVATTVATTTAPAAFDGPSFTETVTPVLAPYSATIGASPDSPNVRALLSAFGDDIPLPPGLTLNGIGHQWTKEFGKLEDAQSVSFGQFLDGEQLKAFGASVSNGWKQASFATSGSLTTLLLTHTDGRRVAFVSDSESSTSGTGRAPLEMSLSTDGTTTAEPGWIASLPGLPGGELVEYIESSGRISDNLVGAGEYVLVRWRYAASQLDALNAYLTSGVVQSAGFSFDTDMFNGFEALVDVTNGDWKGTVLIGGASIDGVEYYDPVWSLGR